MNALVVLGTVSVCALLACGDETGIGFRVSYESTALAAETDVLVLFFFESHVDCTLARDPATRPRPTYGPFTTTLDDEARQHGTRMRRDDVPVGTYTILIEAQDAQGAVLGDGCTPDQTVREGELSKVQLRIEEPA